jgi:hypothetical protein
MQPDRFGNRAMLDKMDEAEPFFILRGQDAFSAYLVGLWADMAESAGTTGAKVTNARQCARAMRNWINKKIPD